MKKENDKKKFVKAMIKGYEGYVIYKNNSIEFFETIEEANDIFENSINAIECGFVEEEVSKYFPNTAEELRTRICKEFDIPVLPLDPEKDMFI